MDGGIGFLELEREERKGVGDGRLMMRFGFRGSGPVSGRYVGEHSPASFGIEGTSLL